MALHSITFLIHQRLVADVPFIESRCRLHVVPPLCPLAVSPADFSHGGELVARGRRSTSLWLQQRKPVHDQVRILGFHRHHLPGRGEPLVHGSAW
jgi:NTE family protein